MMEEEGDDRIDLGQHPGARGDARINALLARIVLCMAEMEEGWRPVGSLDAIASPLAARRIRHLVHHAHRGPGRERRHGRRTIPLRVRSASSFHPSAGVTEGVVVIARESRTCAYCIRLEDEGGVWRVVELARPDGGLRPAVTAASRTGAVPVDEHGVRRSSGSDSIAFAVPPLPDLRAPQPDVQQSAPERRVDEDATVTGAEGEHPQEDVRPDRDEHPTAGGSDDGQPGAGASEADS